MGNMITTKCVQLLNERNIVRQQIPHVHKLTLASPVHEFLMVKWTTPLWGATSGATAAGVSAAELGLLPSTTSWTSETDARASAYT